MLNLALRVDLLHGSLYLWCGSRAKACNGAALGERDGLVGIILDEVLDNSLVGPDAGIAILDVCDIALAVGLEHRVGEH